jgi:hypothetical protein
MRDYELDVGFLNSEYIGNNKVSGRDPAVSAMDRVCSVSIDEGLKYLERADVTADISVGHIALHVRYETRHVEHRIDEYRLHRE